MRQPIDHPTFRPNIPFEDIGIYREGLENEPPANDHPYSAYNALILIAGLAIGLTFLLLAFWPVIVEFFTPFKLAFLGGTFFGVFVGMAIIGLVTKPCGDEDAQTTDRIDPETVRAMAFAGSIWKPRGLR